MKRLPQFFAVLALAAALFAVSVDEARAHSETNHVSLPLSAWYADWDSINHFIDQHGAEALNVRHDSGETALSFAAEAGHLPVVLTLLALGVDVNLPNYDNITPLHYAGRDGNIPLAVALISAGASLNVKIADPTGPVYTPLSWAGAQEQTAIFPLLIWAGGHWGEPCADGEIASMVPNADPEAPGLWPPSPACVPSPRTRCAAANWDYNADRDVCAINSYEGANLADSGRSNCRTPGAPAGVADASPLCSAAFGAGWDFPTKPTTGDTSPYYVYNCDPNGTLGMIPATVNTVGATECACADAGKVVIGGRQVGVSGTTVTVTAGGRCAVCPNEHILPDGGCAAAAAASVNAALLAEVGKDFPDVADVAAARRALDGGANPNLTTSAGVPVLVAAALGLHAEVVSVLIKAGADPLVKVAGIFEGNGGFNIQTLSAFIPGALAERVFLDRKTRAKFPVGRRLAETIIHFGDAAGDKFDWGAVDRSRTKRRRKNIHIHGRGAGFGLFADVAPLAEESSDAGSNRVFQRHRKICSGPRRELSGQLAWRGSGRTPSVLLRRAPRLPFAGLGRSVFLLAGMRRIPPARPQSRECRLRGGGDAKRGDLRFRVRRKRTLGRGLAGLSMPMRARRAGRAGEMPHVAD